MYMKSNVHGRRCVSKKTNLEKGNLRQWYVFHKLFQIELLKRRFTFKQQHNWTALIWYQDIYMFHCMCFDMTTPSGTSQKGTPKS